MRADPFSQRVAIKILRPGMGSADLLARFEDERETLAQLDHPGIAAILDAGATPDGRPWFAMPFVSGVPITHHCDSKRLPLDARLGMFRQVCDAIAYTHRRGVIHRDLTPWNILVADVDGRPRPVVVDFGIAKAMSRPRRVQSELHAHRKILGTPAYMAPEQTRPGAPIGPPADVFSLGSLLCELLVGRTPLDPDELDRLPIDELYGLVREAPRPTLPAVCEAMSDEEQAAAAAARATEVGELRHAIRRELTWIVRCALEIEPDRRYASAEALGAEIGRHLRDEVLVVGPESLTYRIGKFVRRHRGSVLVGAAVATMLVVATIVAIWFGVGEARARIEAQARAEETRQVAEFQADMLEHIDRAEAGAMLMRDLRERLARIEHVDADVARGPGGDAERSNEREALSRLLDPINATDLAVAFIDRTILQPSIAAIDRRFKDQPLVDAQLRQTLGEIYRALSHADQARPLLEAAQSTRRRLLGDQDPATLQSTFSVGFLLLDQGKSNEAEPFLRDAVRMSRQLHGEEHHDTIVALRALSLLSRDRHDYVDAERQCREALEIARRVLGENDSETLDAMIDLAVLRQLQGSLPEAETYMCKALAGLRVAAGDDDPQTVLAIMSLGYLFETQGKFNEAEALYREGLERRRRLLGDDHRSTLNAVCSVTDVLVKEGRFADAEAMLLESMQAWEARQGPAEAFPGNIAGRLSALYRAWDAAEPGKGYDAKAAEWQRMPDVIGSSPSPGA
ncbi:MAG: serine/threonine-protein kinase [Phycisphaerales bacterium]